MPNVRHLNSLFNSIKCFRFEQKYSELLSIVSVELCDRKTRSSRNKSRFNSFENKWGCKKCAEHFPTVRQLRKHRKETHRRNVNINRYNFSYNQPEGIYSCNNCSKKSRIQDEMEEHVQTHEAYICSVCGNEFYSLYKFSVHNQTHDSSWFKCPLCDYQTVRKTAILRHINTNHLNKYIYNCNICGKGFEDAANFRDHQNGHAGAKAFSCIVCQKEFPFNRYLLAHQKRNHMVTIDGVLLPNQCPVCKRILSKPSNLEKHMIQHDAAFLQATHHLCDICGKGFARKDKLRLHYRMHTGVKPYKCSYCTKSFAKREYLIMHERIHSGEKPFGCEYCGKAFNQRTSLKTHVRGHTGERPYICHICKTGFISKNSLNLHFKTCNG